MFSQLPKKSTDLNFNPSFATHWLCVTGTVSQSQFTYLQNDGVELAYQQVVSHLLGKQKLQREVWLGDGHRDFCNPS